jgi:hypothetical protein
LVDIWPVECYYYDTLGDEKTLYSADAVIVCHYVRSWVMPFSTRVFTTVVVFSLLANCALAETVVYQVTGTVNEAASNIDLPVYVPLPTTISGSLVYNTANADTDPAASHALYYLESLTMTMGGYTITAAPGQAMLDTLANPLSYQAYTDNGSVFIPEAGQITGIHVKLFDLAGSSTGTDAFPLSPPDPAAFDSAEFSIKYAYAGLGIDIDIVGTVDTIVPEPATISLLALAPLFLRKKRR